MVGQNKTYVSYYQGAELSPDLAAPVFAQAGITWGEVP